MSLGSNRGCVEIQPEIRACQQVLRELSNFLSIPPSHQHPDSSKATSSGNGVGGSSSSSSSSSSSVKAAWQQRQNSIGGSGSGDYVSGLSDRDLARALRAVCRCLAADASPLPLLLEDAELAAWVGQRRLEDSSPAPRVSQHQQENAKVAAAVVEPLEKMPVDCAVVSVEAGDVIELRYYCLPHLVVAESVERVESRPPVLRAIHFGRPSLLEGIRVLREDFRLGDKSRRCAVLRFPPGECRPPAEVVARARSCLGESGHSIVENNAGHFARWCKLYGGQRMTHAAAFESQAELRRGDHVEWPAPAGTGWVHGEVLAVGRRQVDGGGDDSLHQLQLLALRLLVSAKEANAAGLEFGHKRMVSGHPDTRVTRYRQPRRKTDQQLLGRRAAAFVGTTFQSFNRFSALAFAMELACGRDPLSSLALGDVLADPDSNATATAASATECVTFAELQVGDVAALEFAPAVTVPSLILSIRHATTNSLEVTAIVYGHATTDVAREPVREFICIADYRRPSRLRLNVCLHDECHLTPLFAPRVHGYSVKRRLTAPTELLPGSAVSFRQASVAFQHAIVCGVVIHESGSESESGGGGGGGNKSKIDVDLTYFTQLHRRLRKVRHRFDLSVDEVFEIEYKLGETLPLAESLARAESRIGSCDASDAYAIADSVAWRQGNRYDFQANNSRQFARWCRLRDCVADAGHHLGVKWLQPWQSRLESRPLTEAAPLQHSLHRCLQAAARLPETSPLAVLEPLMSVCLQLCARKGAGSGGAAQQLRRALSPGFFAVMSATINGSGVDDARSPEARQAQAFLFCATACVAAASLDYGELTDHINSLRDCFRP